jgi:hypothetical protein
MKTTASDIAESVYATCTEGLLDSVDEADQTKVAECERTRKKLALDDKIYKDCIKRKTCATREETDDFFKKPENRVKLLYKATYTDSKDSRQLVKSYINDRTNIQLEKGKEKEVNLYIRPGVVKTRYLYKKRDYDTYQIETVTNSEALSETHRFSAFVSLDHLKVTIKRNEYDFLVWLAMLGGI